MAADLVYLLQIQTSYIRQILDLVPLALVEIDHSLCRQARARSTRGRCLCGIERRPSPIRDTIGHRIAHPRRCGSTFLAPFATVFLL